MSTALTFLGIAGYEIVGPEHCTLIAPCLSENLAACWAPTTYMTHHGVLV